MGTLKIEFKKEFHLDTDDQDGEQCHCELTVALPKDENGEVVELLRNRNRRIFGCTLSSGWGGWGPNVGEGTQTISAANWNKLSQLVDQKISEIDEVLREVKEENERLMAEKPEDETIVTEI